MPTRRTTGRTPAFTLIELLVVVAIIALLISILLPSLAAARQNSRTAVCASNSRQIAVGWAIYAQEHKDMAVAGRPGSLPGDNLYFVGNGWKFRPRWLASLGAAVEIYAFNEPRRDGVHQNIENRLLVCTEVADWTSERNASYGYNFQFLGNARLTNNGSGHFVRYPVKTEHMLSARTVVLADSLGTAAEFPANQRNPNRPDGSAELAALGNHAYMLDPPRLTDESDRCDSGTRGGPDDRHGGLANFAFADGHVARNKPEELGYVRAGDGRYLVNDPDSHNSLFSGTGLDADPPRLQDGR